MKAKILLILMLTFSVLWSVDIYDIDAGKFLKLDVDSLKVVAYEAYQNQNYEKAAANYLQYLEHDTKDGSSIYNLACCYGLLGKEALAAHYLAIAYDKGYTNIEHFKADSDFDKIRDGKIFSALIDSLSALQKPDSQIREVTLSEHLTPTLLRLPTDFEQQKSYPLVVALHGYGDTADNFSNLFKKSTNYILVTLESAYPFNVGGSIGYSWSIYSNNTQQRDESFRLSAKQVKNCIENMKNRFNISQVMLTGFSQGGGLTYLTALSYPRIIDLAVPFGGFYPEDLITDKMVKNAAKEDFPFIIGHGQEDRSITLEETTNSEKLLKSAGFDVTTKIYPGGHHVDVEILQQVIENFVSGE
jgi:predicted esterase